MCEPNAHCQNNSQIHVNSLLFNLVWTKPRLIPSPDTADVLRTTIGFDTLCTVTHSSLLIRTTAHYEGGSHLWFFSLPGCCITSEHWSPAETKSYLSKNWYLFGYKRSNCCWKLWFFFFFLKTTDVSNEDIWCKACVKVCTFFSEKYQVVCAGAVFFSLDTSGVR